MNLLEELKKELKNNDKTIEDIKWVGTKDYKIDMETFLELADTEYDETYGAQEVATNLLIVGDDWYIDREEYDGSEWFEFRAIPKEPTKHLEAKALTVYQAWEAFGKSFIGWKSLEKLNGIIDKEETD